MQSSCVGRLSAAVSSLGPPTSPSARPSRPPSAGYVNWVGCVHEGARLDGGCERDARGPSERTTNTSQVSPS